MSGGRPVVIVGIGELGSVLARGFLSVGTAVHPVTRSMSLLEEAARLPDPALVLVAVGEKDLGPVLQRTPAPWRTRLGLVQNELLPRDWQRHEISQPTVAVVWLEKKRGREVSVLMPTLVAGPRAEIVVRALGALELPARVIPDGELLFELARKNLYILTVNIAGLRTGGTVGDLWRLHEPLARAVASEVLDVQEHLAGTKLPRERLFESFLEAVGADPGHECTGRTARGRLDRLLGHAREAGLGTPVARGIAEELLQSA